MKLARKISGKGGGGRGYLDGQMLIAMPAMSDERFMRSLIYICAHSSEGAMGIIVNHPAKNINFPDLLVKLDVIPAADLIQLPNKAGTVKVLKGGPVETERGFVLHSADFFIENSTLPIDEGVCLTASLDILKAVNAKTTPPPPHFGPDVDGYFLPDSVPNIYAAGNQAHIPLLAGWNADEVRGAVLLAPKRPTADSFTTQAQTEFGANAQKFLAVYPAATDAEALTSAGDFVSDRFIAFSTWRWLEAQVATGKAPVYRYRLDLGSPGDKYHPAILGAFHSDDIEYVFGTLDSRHEAVWRPEDRKLSDQMGAYWTNFARTGDPNGPNLPKWPTYGPTEWQVMHLDATCEARPDDHRDRYLFLDQVWGKPKAEPAAP